MMLSEQQRIYKILLEHLEQFENKGLIKIMKRGVSKKFAFQRVRLDPQLNSLDQFAKKLFFYGEKSKYFWEQKLGRKFSINDTGQGIFRYIFEKFKEISELDHPNQGTTNYRIRNKIAFEYL